MRKIIFIGLMMAASCAQAQFKTGNKLLQQLNGEFGDQMNAIGYVVGVADTLQNAVVCAPQTINAGQLVDMTKLYLEKMPAQRHLAADMLIHDMLKSMWPCAKRGGGV